MYDNGVYLPMGEQHHMPHLRSPLVVRRHHVRHLLGALRELLLEHLREETVG